MKITHFGGVEECDSIAKLHAVLEKRYGNNANEFWINNKQKTPCFGVMVKDEYAYIQYFPDDESAGFVGKVENNNLPPEEIMIFYTNTVDEEIEVLNEMVVLFSEVEKVVIDFYNNCELSKCLNWNVL